MKRRNLFMGLAAAVTIVLLCVIPAYAGPGGVQEYDDYIGNYNFKVEIEGVDAGHFTSVDGLSIEQEVIEYQNGDDPLTRKRPGRVSYGEVTLTKQYAAGSILNDWIEQARLGNSQYTRKNVSVILTDQQGTQLKRWNLFECFPMSWKLITLDSKSDDTLYEELVIVVEYFEES